MEYNYEVYDGDELINRIYATEEFAEQYALETGYTLVKEPGQEIEPEPSPSDIIEAITILSGGRDDELD